MKRFLIPLLFIIFSPINHGLADLGEAEIPEKTTFNIWCGKRKNDCKVSFIGDKLVVNDGLGITRDQVLVIDYFWNSDNGDHTYTIPYKKEDGTQSAGVFLIKSRVKWAKKNKVFRVALVRWSGLKIEGDIESGIY